MGFFDTVKNFVTGGGAKLTIELPEKVEIGRNFNIKVGCTAEASITPNRVYLILESVEIINVPIKYNSSNVKSDSLVGNIASEVMEDQFSSNDSRSRTRNYKKTTQLYKKELDLEGSITLQEGQSKNWESELAIPEDAEPQYNGKYAKHIWRIKAGLDVPGNDPDSGWVTINLAPPANKST